MCNLVTQWLQHFGPCLGFEWPISRLLALGTKCILQRLKSTWKRSKKSRYDIEFPKLIKILMKESKNYLQQWVDGKRSHNLKIFWTFSSLKKIQKNCWTPFNLNKMKTCVFMYLCIYVYGKYFWILALTFLLGWTSSEFLEGWPA